MITLEEKFDGHIILYCKNHYNLKNVDFITGLQRIWAVRCGLDVQHINSSFNEYIADKMHEIFAKCKPNKLSYFHQILFKGLCDEWGYEGLNAIERVIMIYANELFQLQIKEKVSDKRYKTLIKLPKPQKQVFKRIVAGKARGNEYNSVKY
jgi:hypothetical protein